MCPTWELRKLTDIREWLHYIPFPPNGRHGQFASDRDEKQLLDMPFKDIHRGHFVEGLIDFDMPNPPRGTYFYDIGMRSVLLQC